MPRIRGRRTGLLQLLPHAAGRISRVGAVCSPTRTLRPDLRRATRSAALNPGSVTALVTRSVPREVLRGVIGGTVALPGHDLTMPERQRRVVRYGVLMTTRIQISALFLVRPEVSEVEDHPPRACPAAAARRHHIGDLPLPRRIRQR